MPSRTYFSFQKVGEEGEGARNNMHHFSINLRHANPPPQPEVEEEVALVTPRVRGRADEGRGTVRITRGKLEALFGGSLLAASRALGICPTAIKKACRRFGIAKWPYKSPNPGPKPRVRSPPSRESEDRKERSLREAKRANLNGEEEEAARAGRDSATGEAGSPMTNLDQLVGPNASADECQ